MELSGALMEGVVDRLTRPDYRAFEAQLRSSGYCARPVRLRPGRGLRWPRRTAAGVVDGWRARRVAAQGVWESS
jgi:hypothetical protein